MSGDEPSEQPPRNLLEFGPWRATFRETWIALAGPGLQVSKTGRFSFPIENSSSLLDLLNHARFHALVSEWRSRGGRSLRSVYRSVEQLGNSRLLLDPLNGNGTNAMRSVRSMELPYADLFRLSSVLADWIAAHPQPRPATQARETWSRTAMVAKITVSGSSRRQSRRQVAAAPGQSPRTRDDPASHVTRSIDGAWRAELGESSLHLYGVSVRHQTLRCFSFQQTHTRSLASILSRVLVRAEVREWQQAGGTFIKVSTIRARREASRVVVEDRSKRESSKAVDFVDVPYTDLQNLQSCIAKLIAPQVPTPSRSTGKSEPRDLACPVRGCRRPSRDPLTDLCAYHYKNRPIPIQIVRGGAFEQNRRRH